MNPLTRPLIMLAIISLSPALQAGVTGEEKEAIKDFVLDRYTVEYKLLNDENLSALSSTRFFEVKIIQKTPNGATSTETLRMYKDGESYKELEWLGSTKKCEELMELFDKKIIIKTEQDAKSVEAALDLLYPVGRFDEKHRKISKEGNQWIFVRGDIFDDLKGFQFTVDAEGVVTAINYRTDIKP